MHYIDNLIKLIHNIYICNKFMTIHNHEHNSYILIQYVLDNYVLIQFIITVYCPIVFKTIQAQLILLANIIIMLINSDSNDIM